MAFVKVPPHARAVSFGRGHRFAAYPRCSADKDRGSMILAAIKHFCAVGVLFSLFVGWMAATIVLAMVEELLKWILGHPATELRWCALLLNALSILTVCVATSLGNRLYRASSREPLSAGALVVSTLCYSGVVVSFAVPQFAWILGPMMRQVSYAYRGPVVAYETIVTLCVAALPVAVLPAWYLLSGSVAKRTDV
jgi:hypothetical protein